MTILYHLNGDIVAMLETSYDGDAQNYFDNICTLKIVNVNKIVYKSNIRRQRRDI